MFIVKATKTLHYSTNGMWEQCKKEGVKCRPIRRVLQESERENTTCYFAKKNRVKVTFQ